MLRELLSGATDAEDDIFQRLAIDLGCRESLLTALLMENKEPRIRQILIAETPAEYR